MNRYENGQNELVQSNNLKTLNRIFSLPDIHKSQAKPLMNEDINKSLLSPRKIKKLKMQFNTKASSQNLPYFKSRNSVANKELFAQSPRMFATFDYREDFRASSEISMYAEKENEMLQNSYDLLDQANILKPLTKDGNENVLGLLRTARHELKKMTHKLTYVVAKDINYCNIDRMSPNVVVVKPKATRYFKIPLKNTRPPLKILIFNSDGHEYKVFVSKK